MGTSIYLIKAAAYFGRCVEGHTCPHCPFNINCWQEMHSSSTTLRNALPVMSMKAKYIFVLKPLSLLCFTDGIFSQDELTSSPSGNAGILT